MALIPLDHQQLEQLDCFACPSDDNIRAISYSVDDNTCAYLHMCLFSVLQVVHISRNSLQMASESTHPVSRSGSGAYRFLRATYTAGSMAGLGFSMAILGICVGIFLGMLYVENFLTALLYTVNTEQEQNSSNHITPD